jgi:hypothetical protein
MKTIRVFVSSPEAVQAERIMADWQIRMIAEESGIPVNWLFFNAVRAGLAVATSISESIREERVPAAGGPF